LSGEREVRIGNTVAGRAGMHTRRVRDQKPTQERTREYMKYIERTLAIGAC
jgi:hypothetical protein